MMRKWRPSLALVLGGALFGTLGLSLLGLIALRYLGPEIGFRNAAMGLAAVIGLVTLGLGWLLARLLLRPILALEAYAESKRMRPMDPAPEPEHYGTKEISATARGVIEMADTLRNREVTIRSFTDHATHELKTPLTAIRAAAELLEDGGALSSSDRRLVSEITGAASQMETQMEALRDIARAREPRHRGASCLADVIPALQTALPELSFQVTGAKITLPLAQEGLTVVLQQLAGNALSHGAARLTLDADSASLTIGDDGPGVSPGHRDRIFEPFFTSRRRDGGTGMGLAIVRGLLEAHGAQIALLDQNPGAWFKITF